ncbi:hypothetical protein FN846DRAFT_770920 [Sphaerosporella brunnea]|uniref:RING-type domain-containing protein n=1 Tax=Sphaerosporella brunnea TaxID=1250544 RepID=A0A5J5FC83_9PEZI|nr:hypothetical protein FN846DRAFT_770920 [Sphaerosporella brunnea]
MPFPRLQTLLLMLSMLMFLLLLCYFSFTTFAPSQRGQATSSFLFPASAVISLTDDNSTFFISRPAAFGPSLPKNGMDGELFVLEEGQLACDDIPGWDLSAALDYGVPTLPQGVEDDGTDNILNPTVPSTLAKTSTGGGHADIQSLQQSAAIEGKIVLVQRGGCGFLEKVLWTQRRGGIALIVGDYKRPGIGGGSSGLVTMYAKGDTSNVSIPSLFTSHTTAALLTTLLPKEPNPSRAHQKPGAKPSAYMTLREPPIPTGRLHTARPAERATPTSTVGPSPTSSGKPHEEAPPAERTGLWITLTPTTMTSSPFFDTLLVLVVSPLVTLTVVYALLLIRSRIRRRRWRAPKSLVERLPVRTYQSTVTPPPAPPAPPVRRTSSPSSAQFHRRWSGCNECVVCLEEYVDGVSRVMKLPCGHEFHVGCITPWLTTRRRTCPICKGDVVRAVRAITDPSGDGYDGSEADERTPLVGVEEEDEDLERGGGSSERRG